MYHCAATKRSVKRKFQAAGQRLTQRIQRLPGTQSAAGSAYRIDLDERWKARLQNVDHDNDNEFPTSRSKQCRLPPRRVTRNVGRVVMYKGSKNMKPFHFPPLRLISRYRLIGLILAVSAILMGVVLFIHFWTGIPIGKLTRDPATIGGLPVYTGFLSQIGIFFWAASSTLCFFAARVLSGHAKHHKFRRFLLVSGLLTLLLGLDDAFLLHETVLPHFGIPENLVLGSYAGFVLLYLVRFYPLIFETEYFLLVIA